MPQIRKIQSRDIQALADTFPHQDYDYFETLYIEQLQEQRQVFVVVEKDDEGERHYYAYVSLSHESNYTQFWRRNIPEITDLYVLATHRKQGIATQLIVTCEQYALKSGYQKLGISIEKSDDNAHLQAIYEKAGYSLEGQSNREEKDYIHLWKALS